MSELTPARPMYCRSCGVELQPGRMDCWLCGSTASSPEPPRQLPARPQPVDGDFTLSTVFLAVTLVCVLLGLAVAAPGLGIGLMVVSAPAWIRAAVISSRSKAKGERLSSGEKVAAFMGSLGVMIATAAAVGVAFFITCFATCFGLVGLGSDGEGVLVISVLIGLIAGIPILVLMVRRLW